MKYGKHLSFAIGIPAIVFSIIFLLSATAISGELTRFTIQHNTECLKQLENSLGDCQNLNENLIQKAGGSTLNSSDEGKIIDCFESAMDQYGRYAGSSRIIQEADRLLLYDGDLESAIREMEERQNQCIESCKSQLDKLRSSTLPHTNGFFKSAVNEKKGGLLRCLQGMNRMSTQKIEKRERDLKKK